MIFSKKFKQDLLAPIAVYAKLKALYKDEITYLFESAGQSDGNYSFICIGARERLQYINNQTIYTDADAKIILDFKTGRGWSNRHMNRLEDRFGKATIIQMFIPIGYRR